MSEINITFRNGETMEFGDGVGYGIAEGMLAIRDHDVKSFLFPMDTIQQVEVIRTEADTEMVEVSEEDKTEEDKGEE